MGENIIACCNAPSLSYLLFESTSCLNEQKGLLLGTVKRHVFTTTTDENEAKEEEKTVIYIEHSVAMDGDIFEGGHGKINENKLNWLITSFRNKIVGWYTYHTNIRNPRTFSSKELLIHRQLCDLFASHQRHLFPVAILNSSMTDPATHAFGYYLLTQTNTGFRPLRLKICNLSDRSNDYATQFPAFSRCQGFEDSIKNSVNVNDPMNSIQVVKGISLERLSSLCSDLLALENERLALEKEATLLRGRLGLLPKPVPVVKNEPEPEMMPKLQTITYQSTERYNEDRKRDPMQVNFSPSDEEEEENGDVLVPRSSSFSHNKDVIPSASLNTKQEDHNKRPTKNEDDANGIAATNA